MQLDNQIFIYIHIVNVFFLTVEFEYQMSLGGLVEKYIALVFPAFIDSLWYFHQVFTLDRSSLILPVGMLDGKLRM